MLQLWHRILGVSTIHRFNDPDPTTQRRKMNCKIYDRFEQIMETFMDSASCSPGKKTGVPPTPPPSPGRTSLMLLWYDEATV